MELEKAFGETVRLARKAADLSQEELAEALDMQQAAISRLERGIISPSLHTIGRIATALGTVPSALLQQTEQIQTFAHAQTAARAEKSRRK